MLEVQEVEELVQNTKVGMVVQAVQHELHELDSHPSFEDILESSDHKHGIW